MSKFEDEIEFSIIKSEQTKFLSVDVGVKAKHQKTGITAESTSYSSQHQNKLSAIEILKEELVKERFLNIDESDLVDGEQFMKDLDSGKYD
ncbi:peptide chain release factor-like protein [Aliiglaciecola sp. SL4]|jgi:hypothetical protein|uniref:peptide chain release factor family protein n=1 Tax=Aliiglaciecola sp. SL4 TaxID=3239806 RepID=UPI00355B5F43